MVIPKTHAKIHEGVSVTKYKMRLAMASSRLMPTRLEEIICLRVSRCFPYLFSRRKRLPSGVMIHVEKANNAIAISSGYRNGWKEGLLFATVRSTRLAI